MPGLLYSLVTRGTSVLAEFTESGLQGNFASITRVLLKKIPNEDGKLSYVYDEFVFHYVVSGGVTYLCMCDKDFSRVVAFNFLAKIETEFLRLYSPSQIKSATAYSFNGDFQRILSRYMAQFSNVKDEKINKITEQISEIKDVMTKNIDKVLDRGERIEILVEKSNQMEISATRFQKKSTQLRRKFCCQNIKWWIFLGIVLLAVIYLILALACGGPKIPKCT